MFTVVWSHSHCSQCGASPRLGAPPEKNDLAWRYFSELNGSPALPSNVANSRFASGLGEPQHSMILPVASITMFLYNQWQVWPTVGGASHAACSSHGLSKARAIVSASTLSGNGSHFSAKFALK